MPRKEVNSGLFVDLTTSDPINIMKKRDKKRNTFGIRSSYTSVPINGQDVNSMTSVRDSGSEGICSDGIGGMTEGGCGGCGL